MQLIVSLAWFFLVVNYAVAGDPGMSCEQFNALGSPVPAGKQVLDVPPSSEQIQAYKTVIADYAGEVAFKRITPRARALAVAQKSGQLVVLVRESLAMTRYDCATDSRGTMSDRAINNFNYMLDAIAKRL